MKEKEFLNWLVKSGLKETTAESVVSRVRRIEKTYPELDSRFEDGSIETLLNVFTYTKNDEAKKRIPLHKIEIDGKPYSGTQSLRNALAQYIEFMQNNKKDAPVSRNAELAETRETTMAPTTLSEGGLYKIDEFREWMHWREEMTRESAKSYVSFLNTLRLNVTRKSDGVLIMDYISNLLRDGNLAEALELLEKVDEAVSRYMLSDKVDKHEKTRFNNSRSALRKYVLFLENIMEELPDEEELDDVETSDVDLTTLFDGESVDKTSENLTYSKSDLKRNFVFRLKTQNRMSNHKDIFYPIGMICKLFNYSQRKSKRNGEYNNDAEWLNDWFNDYADAILAITADGEYPLSTVKEIMINPEDGKVCLLVNECCEEFVVFTETTQKSALPMEAKRLRDIHIDHTPLMSDVLSASVGSLPALAVMSDLIKKTAKQKRLDIKPSNFGKISKSLFENTEIVDAQLLPLIPELKKELDILRGKCVLKLMQGSHNLKKK